MESKALKPQRIKGFGWKPDPPDPRDRAFAPRVTAQELPRKKSLRAEVSQVFDQGDLGSCTANATAAMLRFVERKQGERTVALSRLFIYYWTRYLEGTTNEDAGAFLRDVLKVVAKQGAPPEKEWPYKVENFRSEPPQELGSDALEHQAIQYLRLSRSLQAMKSCIVEGFPFVFGFAVFESFYKTGPDGIAPVAGVDEPLEGWHAVMCVGYDDVLYGGAGGFWMLNSWGKSFGKGGFFTLPYHVLMDPQQSNDFWTVRAMS